MDKQSTDLLSVKNDFVFKLIFGHEKQKDLLAAFLSAVLHIPEDEFSGLEIINTELLREFKEDKKGILDIRVKTKKGEQINVEIQILPSEFMAHRTLFYISKMFVSQVRSGDKYDLLKKCITINIVDFKCIPVNRIHTSFQFTEKHTGYLLSDLMEVHFLELPKLKDREAVGAEEDAVIDWLTFINSSGNREVMEMLAERNEKIKRAFEYLEVISKDEKARMIYEAREAELMDQRTRIWEAENRGLQKGKHEGLLEGMHKGKQEGLLEGMQKGKQEGLLEGLQKEKRANARNLLALGVPIDTIAKAIGLSVEEIKKLQ